MEFLENIYLCFSAVKIKTASRITFALPPQSASPVPTNVFDSIHPTSPQMPPTTTATSIDTQTDDLFHSDQQCQTGSIQITNQSIQTDSTNPELISIGIQCQSDSFSEKHIICRDLTTCACVDQLTKTRQFLIDTTNKLQLPTVSNKTKISKQTMTAEESSALTMVLAKSSLKSEQQVY
jgi:hypothetical protein